MTREQQLEEALWAFLRCSRHLQNKKGRGKPPATRRYVINVLEEHLLAAQELLGDSTPVESNPRPRRYTAPRPRRAREIRWPD